MKNIRNTQQKRIIMQALAEADHPTASELYESVHNRYPAISRATVFRVLSQYAERGEAVKLNISEGSARYDACLKPHAHARCIVCGKVYDLFGEEFESLLNLRGYGEFDILSTKIEFTAICKDCKDKKS